VKRAVEAYENTDAGPLEFFDHMYAERTPELEKQRAELQKYLSVKNKRRISPPHQPSRI
jgi:hypothetical protein